MKASFKSNSTEVLKRVRDAEKQARYALMRTLNETAFEVRRAERAEIQNIFQGPTSYILNSVFVGRASRTDLKAEVYLRYPGGKGVDPSAVLKAEVYGGQRRAKRAEVAFQRIGLLPAGWGMVPTNYAPTDANGNVPGSFIVRIISYFQAFGEQGYRANMTAKRKAKLANAGRTAGGAKVINGAQYFVSRGFGNTAHLGRAIWERSGIHGSRIRPIFIFVPLPFYQRRFAFHDIAHTTAKLDFTPRFHRNLADAWRTAR